MNPGHFYVDLLAAEGPSLGEPYTRQLDGVLRFYLDDLTMRISYWIASDRRIILLTVFHKTRMREDREVDRARRALSHCKGEAHSVDEEW
ncbi:type II toxin-antitoxin system RelE/ParE family toxin [Nonomuraea sp. NPDC003709]|uniref:type II toxin-antitoxin system RelE/ParE family toxin n=1 Tax=Nonomuraea sp. NPDC003709 TaxID=3154450 RepID=UPI0033BBA9EE